MPKLKILTQLFRDEGNDFEEGTVYTCGKRPESLVMPFYSNPKRVPLEVIANVFISHMYDHNNVELQSYQGIIQ